VPEGHTGPLDVVCKATDAAYNTQPEAAASVWNIRGLANNAYHHVRVNVADE
jgi:sulfite oxidase